MIKKIFKYSFIIAIIGLLFIFVLDYYIQKTTSKYIYSTSNNIPNCYTALVLGAKVYNDGSLSGILRDRVNTALELYKVGKIKRFLLSGDHGREDYDEVNQMKIYLQNKGVKEVDIFLDHAGFDTYNSAYRAKHIFLVNDVIIISQGFHIKRAVYIARKLGLDAYGIKADKRSYSIARKMVIREKLANVKAFFELLSNKKPTYLGEQISIKEDSKKSYD